MDWQHPEFLWTLAAVPAVVALFVWAAWQRRRAAARFGDAPLVARLAAAVSSRRRRYKAALLVDSARTRVGSMTPQEKAALRRLVLEFAPEMGHMGRRMAGAPASSSAL